MVSENYSLKFELGIALSIFSLPLAWSISHILGHNYEFLSDLFMVIALLLLMDVGRPLLRIRKIELLYIVYHVLILFYIVFCEGRSVMTEMLYNGFTLAVFILVIVQNRNKNFSKLIRCFCFLGGLVILITFIYATNFLTVWSWGTRFSLAESGDPLTLSDRILMAMIAFFLLKPKNLFEKSMKYIFLAMGLVGLLATGVRKTLLFIVMLLLINAYYSLKDFVASKTVLLKSLKTLFVCTIVFAISIYILNSVPAIRDSLLEQFDLLVKRTISGVQSYSGKEMTDVSAMTRIAIRDRVVNRWFNEDGIIQILFGHGYIETYVDIPIIQIFSDTGILIGIVYVLFSVVLPIKIILQRNGTEDLNIRLLKLMVAPILINQFVTGVPYGYRLWLPMTYLLALVDIRSHPLGAVPECENYNNLQRGVSSEV